jgi:hypothetical protein
MASMIVQLKNTYPPAAVKYETSTFVVGENTTSTLFVTDKVIVNTGFMGSDERVVMYNEEITHEAPACIAAPVVTMVANKSIVLGLWGQRSADFPVRLYVPQELSIKAKRLYVGDIQFIVEPQVGSITCEYLLLARFTQEDPPNFELVKSWISNDDVNIEKVCFAGHHLNH